jgi:sugar phosphate isomerase/epimerase
MDFDQKISRKSFIKAGAFALAAPMLSKLDFAPKASSKIGLQLYTLRNEISKDLEGTLKKVAAIGYKEVELFGYSDGKFFGKTSAEFKTLLKGLGLTPVSGHYGAGVETKPSKGTLSNDWKRAMEDAAALGQKYANCAYLTGNERKSIDDYKRHAELFNKSGEVAKEFGIQFGYHNHDFEFQKLDGQIPYDIITANTDPKLVKLELDLYWAVRAGLDPVELFKKHPGRFPLWHVKDMEKGPDKAFAEVGTGSIDFAKIFEARKIAGLTHFFVEQDVCKIPPAEAIAISYSNLVKMKV